jgi:23S rRNA (cytosine1962-C5)-methyltransferase
MAARVFLKADKERPVLGRHPWIFSGAIERTEETSDGDLVDVISASGAFVARGYYNSRSQIAVRVWTLDQAQRVDQAFLVGRLERAIAARRRLGLELCAPRAETSAFRLVNAEADLLPGLVVDGYGPFLAVQLHTAGIDRQRGLILEALERLLRPAGIFERSDAEARAKEGLPPSAGLLSGEEPPPRLTVQEHGLPVLVDIRGGQKTGHYLDQRENRRLCAELLRRRAGLEPRPLELLNAFSYTGGFALHACRAVPSLRALNLDSSSEALELCAANAATNQCADRCQQQAGDVFQELRRFRDAGRSFDAIVLDPPKFAHSRAQVTGACRGYKDLSLLGFKLLRPGGLLFAFSCSGLVGLELFQKVVFDAARDAGRYGRVLARLGPAPDHPGLLSFPEGDYLKGLVVEVAD